MIKDLLFILCGPCPFLSFPEIVSARRVCKEWKNGLMALTTNKQENDILHIKRCQIRNVENAVLYKSREMIEHFVIKEKNNINIVTFSKIIEYCFEQNMLDLAHFVKRITGQCITERILKYAIKTQCILNVDWCLSKAPLSKDANLVCCEFITWGGSSWNL
jgi:hypothetical protein